MNTLHSKDNFFALIAQVWVLVTIFALTMAVSFCGVSILTQFKLQFILICMGLLTDFWKKKEVLF